MVACATVQFLVVSHLVFSFKKLCRVSLYPSRGTYVLFAAMVRSLAPSDSERVSYSVNNASQVSLKVADLIADFSHLVLPAKRTTPN
jgi:hypothetical protein